MLEPEPEVNHGSWGQAHQCGYISLREGTTISPDRYDDALTAPL